MVLRPFDVFYMLLVKQLCPMLILILENTEEKQIRKQSENVKKM